jgi:hypothetical protein
MAALVLTVFELQVWLKLMHDAGPCTELVRGFSC